MGESTTSLFAFIGIFFGALSYIRIGATKENEKIELLSKRIESFKNK